MAKDTAKELRNKIIYEIYVRNHGQNGTFKDVIEDLPRIKDLGVDIVWFMPIHPIGIKNKKGSLGCPYAIRNYREINPEYGSLEDFKQLVNEIHKHGMLCMIDVVFNHTSPDSYLFKEHPEYFYRNEDGDMGNKVGDWYDVIDLDYSNEKLWDEQIDVLKHWVSIGVDGFRCDVAPLVPVEFWQKARKEVEKIKESVIWLSETVETGFITYLRDKGFYAASDSEIYNAFDITYDYDVHPYFKAYLNGEIELEDYLEKIRQQEYIYPDNYVKLRFLENHDQPRIKKLISNEDMLKVWTAFMYFQKGAVLLYGGQEAQDDNTPSLFDIDKINWEGLDIDFINYLKLLGEIKKRKVFAYGKYNIHKADKKGIIYATYEYKGKKLVGIFNVENKLGKLNLSLKDGVYRNLIDNTHVEVKEGKIELQNKALIFEVEE
ncbi:alpha-amylase family glycosyl hydrolase [Caldisalinibacter kiritimatiensis]|uniref:Alpha-amylase n=1 Tax=Caldisalinibacter kiritimatiensis TaxID=1304284 RepID=R1CEQ3_9FIRM|nr:alpha-amylase family glycosyl hydrolase [Caldisalinibacter kiritimatiensis]EOD00790.1 Alpha-amylase [Caldisalinibacter kiritimatiensis]